MDAGHIDELPLAAQKMTGANRRAFQTEMALKYHGGIARRTETFSDGVGTLCNWVGGRNGPGSFVGITTRSVVERGCGRRNTRRSRKPFGR